ncbi:hypothetical protein BN903_28 [Halorubrum sp. AJ67]|nr:hypothetical protein BN903_28 [Halorubrum sp. AJ67]
MTFVFGDSRDTHTYTKRATKRQNCENNWNNLENLFTYV